jgi:signal transduction histidine kinase
MKKSADLTYYPMKRYKKAQPSPKDNHMQDDSNFYFENNEPGFIKQLNAIAKNSKTGYIFFPLSTKGIPSFSDNVPSMIEIPAAAISVKTILSKIFNKKEVTTAVRNVFLKKECQQINIWLREKSTATRCIAAEIKIVGDYIMATTEDITLQKEYESYLHDMNKELEAFLYKSSHNLKGPAASISGLVSIAMHEIKDDNAIKYLNMIKESTEKLNFVLSDLLNVNKIKLGHLEYSELSVDKIISDVRESLKFFSGSADVKINVKLNHRIPLVSDQNLMYSIFQNLIENGIKYSNKEKPHIIISSKDVENGIELSFKDNGQGIPENAQDKIFNMFFRANDIQKGSGLGLYIVKTAVQKIGGNIFVTSTMGKGSTFKVFIPSNSL